MSTRMKNKIIRLLKNIGFERTDTNFYGDDLYGVWLQKDIIIISDNNGDIVEELPMNIYAVIGFFHTNNYNI